MCRCAMHATRKNIMKSHLSAKGPSQRQLRVGEQIKQIIAEKLSRGDFHHESLINAGYISVGEVRVSPDLRNAKAYVMALNEDDDLEAILKALNEESHQFSKEINRVSNMKFTPKIRFVRDESVEEAQRIDDLLRSVHIPDDEE